MHKKDKNNHNKNSKYGKGGEIMRRSGRRTFLLILSFALVAITTAAITYTFARYTNTATGTSAAQVAPWIVKVNGTDITANNTFTAGEINWSDNENIADGYTAPGRDGKFNIEIDPTGAKVAMEYEVSIDTTEFDAYDQIIIYEVKNTTTDEVLTKNSDGNYTGIITLEEVENGTVQDLEVTIKWNNDEANNTSDTTIGSTIEQIQIPVTVTASQYLG